MRGLNSGLRLVSNAAAFVAGAAILAGAAGSAGAQTTSGIDELALAVPRIRPLDGGMVSLPRPLSGADAERVRRVFAAQHNGDFTAAAGLMASMDSRLLDGSILADRFTGRPDEATLAELQDWLVHHATQPEAPAIRSLIVARLPRGAAPPPPVAVAELAPQDPAPEDRLALATPRNPSLDRAVHDAALAGRIDAGLALIAHSQAQPGYVGQLRAEMAQIRFTAGDDAAALELGIAGFHADHGHVALGAYVAALAQWRMGHPELAAPLFQAAAAATITTPALRSAAAFWAARANLRSAAPARYTPWMRRAAAEPRTFYGLLARRALGLGIGFKPDTATLSEADVDAVSALPGGMRAFALLQAGEPDRAEAELRALWPAVQANAPLGRSLLLVARSAGLTGLAAQLASLEQMRDGTLRDDARYPLPVLTPIGGFRADRALIYALARVESNFNPSATSPVGARGLMQLMPVTASYLAGSADVSARLNEPGFNLALGQRYLSYLARQDGVRGDLIRLLAAYNAGPAHLAKWTADARDGGDPLLLIESIPNDETRNFVQHVLAASWLYAARLGAPTQTLDELAAGAAPRFHEALPNERHQVEARLH